MQGYAALLHKHGRRAKGAAGSGAAIDRLTDANSLMQRREELFGLVKRVSGTNRLTELKPVRDSKQKPILYGIDPASRYTHMPRSIPPAQY